MYVTMNESRNGQVVSSGLFGAHAWWSNSVTRIDVLAHPGVEKHSTISLFENEKINLDNRIYHTKILAADSNFLKITGFPLIYGVDRLAEPKSALITQSFAKKLFGDQNPVGKTFQFTDGAVLTITGVLGPTSTKTSFSFDIILSYYYADNWMGAPQIFVKLYPGVDYQSINKQFESFDSENNERFQLYPLSKVYFDTNMQSMGSVYSKGNYGYVIILILVGCLILLIGVINYINIYTVIVLHRGRELGVKKVFGAGRHTIFLQLLVENLLMTVFALFLAFIFTKVLHPFVTNTLHLDQIPNIRFDMLLSFFVLCLLPVIAILYPFFRYYYFAPVNSFRSFDKIRSTDSLRRFFLSFQYITTIAMIIVSLFFVKQLRYMMSVEPGYRTKDIIQVHNIRTYEDSHSFNAASNERSKRLIQDYRNETEIKNRMNNCPLFTGWTYCESPADRDNQSYQLVKMTDGDYKEIRGLASDEHWMKIFGIQLLQGRLWDDAIDNSGNNMVIVTESFLKLFGISDFYNATLQFKGKEEISFRIAGVVKDFNHLHLSQKPAPVVLQYRRLKSTIMGSLIASIVPGRTKDAIEFLRKLQEDTIGGEFEYSFVEDAINKLYQKDKNIASIYSFFTFIAIFVSAMGLFSMSLFDVRQRRKEIAIRKINGATVIEIIRLLLKKYFWTLTISFVIATPVALYAINRYLEDFANKTPVSWWLFAVALVITGGVSLLTLIYQTHKAANQNPAEVVSRE